MRSITKAAVSEENVYALTANAFPDCTITGVQELTEGLFNTAFHIVGTGLLSKGVILKIGPPQGTKLLTYEQNILRTEVSVYGLLAQKDVPVPKVLYADYSRSQISSDYFYMTYVPGILWKDADPEKLQLCRGELIQALGHIHKEIHSVVGSRFGYIKDDVRFQFDSWAKAFGAMMQDVCEDGRRDGLQLPYGQILSTVQRNRAVLEEVTTPQLVDFDMWAGNVILEEVGDGYRINGVIDFERSFFGDPCADFISAVGIFDDVTVEEDFSRGYGKTILFDDNMQIRMDLYRLYLMTIMYVETYRFDEEYATGMKSWLTGGIDKLLQRL